MAIQTSLAANQTVFPLLEDDALAIDTMVENFLIDTHRESCKPLASRICITSLRALEHFKNKSDARTEMNKMFNILFFPKLKAVALRFAQLTSNLEYKGEDPLLTYSRKTHYTKEADLIKSGDFEAVIRMIREETYERFKIETFTSAEADANIKAKYALATRGSTRDVEKLIAVFEKKFYNENIIEALLPNANRFHFNSPPLIARNLDQDGDDK